MIRWAAVRIGIRRIRYTHVIRFGQAAQRGHPHLSCQGVNGCVRMLALREGRVGQRRDWIKVKNIRHAVVIIGGWRPGQGRRVGTIGSLLPDVPDGGHLQYAGHVGTGFTQAMLTDLARRLARLRHDTSPFTTPVTAPHARGVYWVQPLANEVAFTEWTADQTMRHPIWHGLRPGKNPEDLRQYS